MTTNDRLWSRAPRLGSDELSASADARRSSGGLGLLGRFAMISALLVAGLGVLLGSVLHATIERRALDRAEQLAHSISRLAVEPVLVADDLLVDRISDDRVAELDAGLADSLESETVRRVEIFSAAGTVTYSDEAELIGEPFNPGVEKEIAFAGGVTSKLRTPTADGEHATESEPGRLLEVYVPLPLEVDGQDRILGAVELYLPYEPVAADIAADERTLRWTLAAGLLALWLGLFQVVARASRSLNHQLERNRHLALQDPLTGVANRRLLTDRAKQAIETARRSEARVAVLMIDIDRFRQVNDTLGHDVGDQLLRAVAARIREHIRTADTIARIGGDEFAVLMPEVDDVATALDSAQRILVSLREPVSVGALTLEVDASIGVATFPESSDDVARLLRCADVATATAKSEQAGAVAYTEEQDAQTPQRVEMFGELRRAIDNDDLVLHYQPKIDVGLGRVTGMEALVRWAHPAHGLLYPDRFLGVAERTGLIRPLTRFVLDRALRDCRRWRDQGLELTVAVNLSPRNLLDGSLADQVAGYLDNYDLPPSALVLEITESTAMVDPEMSLRVLGELDAAGVTLSVDDYGTGHSSLAYLSRLPVHELKIDRSFVMDMTDDDKSDAIVRSTIDLGRMLGLRVVAEGVERAEAYGRLAELGCDAAQGYWLTRPGPFEGIAAAVEDIHGRLEPRVPAT